MTAGKDRQRQQGSATIHAEVNQHVHSGNSAIARCDDGSIPSAGNMENFITEMWGVFSQESSPGDGPIALFHSKDAAERYAKEGDSVLCDCVIIRTTVNGEFENE